MAKGVKKIRHLEGLYFPDMSVTGTRITIKPEQWAYFVISEWEKDTTLEEQKKNVTWMRQSNDRKVIIKQETVPSTYKFGVRLSKKLCGSYHYYLEASLSGKRDLKNKTGLYLKGYCKSLIVDSKWSRSRKGADLTNTSDNNDDLGYGDTIYLHVETEGLNGDMVTIEIYNEMWNGNYLMRTLYNAEVIDGEINVEISNTSQWQTTIKHIQNNEEFYFKIKDKSGNYIKNSGGNDEHGKYLNIKNVLKSNVPKKPSNQTPTKVYQPDVNAARYEPCKFEVIQITENVMKDGVADNTSVKVFDNGKGLQRLSGAIPQERIQRTIFFKLDSTIIDKDGEEILNNVLKFLLEHKGSTISLNGYACVIGKQNYNKGLSQRRADIVKKFFTDGGLEAGRIISVGKGEVDPTDDKMGRDNVKYKNEASYEANRRVDIVFVFTAHDAQTMVYETIAPNSIVNLTLDVLKHVNKGCFRSKDKHEKKITIKSVEYGKAMEVSASSLRFPVHSQLAWYNPTPLNYIWPTFDLLTMGSSATIYNVYVNSCRWFSNKNNAVIQVKVYPDIKWTLEFNWNHTQPFAYSFGNKLHLHALEEAKKKAIGSEVDRGWSENYGEMEQSFGLSLKAEWNRITQGSSKAPQKLELGHKWEDKIRKTIGVFNRMKSMTEKISNSPLAKGKAEFTIESPKIAFATEWYLERAPKTNTDLTHLVTIGVSAKPLVEAKISIDLWYFFQQAAGNAVCPGAGTIITWATKKLESNVKITFNISFIGKIIVDGKATINTSYPEETKGEVKATGTIQVTVEFKAFAKAGSANIGVEGIVKADATTSVTGGIKVGADKKGIYGSPVGEFGGIKATFVAAATVKFGIFKRSFTYNDEAILVKNDEIKFEKHYLDFSKEEK